MEELRHRKALADRCFYVVAAYREDEMGKACGKRG
jgi:hypothetical protein